MNIEEANKRLMKLNIDNKYETMKSTAAIITKLLEKHKIHPIIVGGLSVEIYTQSEYTTRDIDFVSDGFDIIEKLLYSLKFERINRHFYRKDIEIAIEIAGSDLEGDMNKVRKVNIDNDLHVFLISIEDIIIDRLRASIYWQSEEDRIWGFKLLVNNFDSINITYIQSTLDVKQEKDVFEEWLRKINDKK